MEDRPDLKKSTVTFQYQQRSQSARPATVRVPAGPGVKIVGGELRSMYDERPASKVTLGHTADFSEIKRQYMQSANAPHAPAPGGGGVQGTGEPLPRASTTLGSGAGSTTSRTRKIIYFDGKSHHVVDATDGPGQRWVPPHLKGDDVAPGVQLGVRETPGSVRVKLIGSKFRYLPTMEPGGVSMWSVTAADAAKYGTVGYTDFSGPGAGGKPRPLTASTTLSEYARRTVGHKDYEAATKQLNGVGSWERTQQALLGSMQVGRPSRLLSPAEHMRTLTGAAAAASFSGLRAAA